MSVFYFNAVARSTLLFFYVFVHINFLHLYSEENFHIA